MSTASAGTALITGATAGLGAAYAEELAARGHDIVMVARDQARLEKAAASLAERSGRAVSVVRADLSTAEGIRAVETRLASDAAIDVLVNNAGSALFGPLSAADPDQLESLITLNLTSVTRIAAAAAKAFAGRGAGSIVNISSAFALNIPPVGAVYGAAKAYVIAFTQALAQEFADSPVRVQVVVPGALETTIWDGSGIELHQLPKEAVMSPRDAARAALAGLDAGELVTIPSLPEYDTWKAYDEARLALAPVLSLSQPAKRYTGQS
ncbi:SDR family NAD(P)-dependent oxidoreductase [Streptomyces sp. NPDC088354]|uniref:SDR family NAD(P)-dependent oxidoreductase n=1 Tax=unclassified Streptomyces TaxID=2593676 RepID=UPI0029BD3F56|nr:SDR family NAD(P)-dependent oxidoreductase [Streptomyces sp. MI02-7b]MDX3071158.1 SDR family NAD(P)-dependent oxidoreductase [Streptomyces sp. MI02-7b]